MKCQLKIRKNREDKRNYVGSITKLKLEGKIEENFLKESFIFMISLEVFKNRIFFKKTSFYLSFRLNTMRRTLMAFLLGKRKIMIIPLRFGAIKDLNPKISLILLVKMFRLMQISNLESFFSKV